MESVLLACILLLKLMKEHFTEWLTTGSLAIPFPRAISFIALLKKKKQAFHNLYFYRVKRTVRSILMDSGGGMISYAVIKRTLITNVERASKQCHSLYFPSYAGYRDTTSCSDSLL